MNFSSKEITPIDYSAAAIKTLYIQKKPHSLCFNIHWHERLEIIRIKTGQLKVEVYGNTFWVKEGEMMLFPPKMSHKGYTEDEKVGYDVLMFDLRMFYNETDVCKRFLPLLFDGGAKFQDIISDIETISCVDEICGNGNPDSLEIISLVYKLIHLLFKKHFCKINPEPKTKIKKIIDYIEENYASDISASALSQKFNYSTEHFCRIFKESTGITPTTYIRIYRLEQSLKLLKENKYSISEIASKCGFYDANYFTRCFKAQYGFPPKYYKGKNSVDL